MRGPRGSSERCWTAPGSASRTRCRGTCGRFLTRRSSRRTFQRERRAPNSTVGWGGILERLDPSGSAGLLGFPLYATLGDLFSRHWAFGWLRWRLAEPSRILAPCMFAWLDAASQRTWTAQLLPSLARAVRSKRRARRRRSLSDQIVSLQSPNGSWAWTTLGTSVALVALRCLGVGPNEDPIRRGIAHLRGLRYAEPESKVRQSWARGSVWETAISSDALLAAEGGIPRDAEAAACALRARLLPSGATEFDSGVGRGDHDSTAVVLTFLARLRNKRSSGSDSLLETVIEPALEALLDGQSSAGGWNFAPSGLGRWAARRPPGGMLGNVLDPPSPDITARVLSALAAARQLPFLDVATRDRIDTAIARTAAFLGATQCPEGSWWGRWGDGDLSTTAQVLVALCAAHAESGEEMVSRGRAWLLRTCEHAHDLSAVEAAWAAAGVVASSPLRSIAQDEPVSEVLPPLIRQAVADDRGALRFAYPIVYPHERYAAPGFDSAWTLFAVSFVRVALRRGVSNARREVLWGHPRDIPPP